VTDELQNVMLQRARIDTFVQHYSVGIHIDVQRVVGGMPRETVLMRFACSMSRSIDPRRPYKLSTDDSNSINDLTRVHALKELVGKREAARDSYKSKYECAEARYEQAPGEQRNDKHKEQLPKNMERQQDKYDGVNEKYKFGSS
jgi:Protein of unknown function (DUF3435)